jgi:hypothetical protein
MDMQRICLGPEDRSRLKAEAVGAPPYAERVSTSLAILLLALREGRGDYFPVLDVFDSLEGIRGWSMTKPARRFEKDLRLHWLWYKHDSSARHISRNIGLRWGLNGSGNVSTQ